MLATHNAPTDRNDIPSRQQILVIEAIGDGAEFQPMVLLPGKYLVGSAENCTLNLHGDDVSSRHCMIITDQDQSFVWTFDADTWLNESRIREAVLNAGDQLTVGSVHVRIREATTQERLDDSGNTPADWADGRVGDLRPTKRRSDVSVERISVDRLSIDRHGVDRLSDEMERQLAKLRNEVTSQQQKLTEALERQNASVDRVAEQQREANSSDQRIETANRKESLLRELIISVQERSEELHEQHCVMSAEQARRLYEISRRRNDSTIESALIRTNRDRLELRERELEGRNANLHERTQKWEDAKRRTEQVHSQRDRQATELQAELDHRQTAIDQRDDQLRQLQQECREQRTRIDDRSAQLSDEQAWHAEEHNARKDALSARLTGMAHWESSIDAKRSELDELAESLKTNEEHFHIQEEDWRHRLGLVADTAERQQSFETELTVREQTLGEKQQGLESRADELQQPDGPLHLLVPLWRQS